MGVQGGLVPGKKLRTKPGNVLPSLFSSLLILTLPHAFPSVLPETGLG